MANTNVSHNPWIFSTPIAAQITAEDIEQRRAELRTWSTETGRPLPLPAEWIIRLELSGYVVDLETGQRSRPPATAATPTAIGIAAARVWTAHKENDR